jgi:hypothetical protein
VLEAAAAAAALPSENWSRMAGMVCYMQLSYHECCNQSQQIIAKYPCAKQRESVSLGIMSLPQKLEFVNGIMINKRLCHTVALPFTLNSILKSKRRIMKTQIFSPCNKYNLQKIL